MDYLARLRSLLPVLCMVVASWSPVAAGELPAASVADVLHLPGRPSAQESVARALVAASGGTHLPPPSSMMGFAGLAPEDQARAWSEWVARARHARDRGVHVGDVGRLWPEPDAESVPPATDVQGPRTVSKAFGTRAVWSRETYGIPYEIESAGEGAGFLLVTSSGILRFPEGIDGQPEWAIKIGQPVERWETGDATGDGVRDVFVSVAGYFIEADFPTIFAFDGATGATLMEAYTPLDTLPLWTVTDVDGDGRADLLGVDRDWRLTARSVDGRKLYERALPAPMLADFSFLGLTATSFPAAFAWGDVNGDGTLDAVTASDHRTKDSPSSGPLGIVTSFADLSVYSGRDGSAIWTSETRFFTDYSGPFGLQAGDLTGDRRADPVLWSDEFTRAGTRTGELAVGLRTVSVEAFDGLDGTTVLRDAWTGAVVRPLDVGVPLSNGEPYAVWFVQDLDADGRAEIVATSPSSGSGTELRQRFLGRGAPTKAGDPSVPLYAREVALDGYTHWDLRVRPLDVDADGRPELVAHAIAARAGQEGRLDALTSRVFLIDRSGVRDVAPDRFLAFWSVSPSTRQAYAYVADNDRWVAVDAAGAMQGKGIDFEATLQIVKRYDRNGDGSTDLLLVGLSSLRWIDGRTGAADPRIPRPLLRSVVGAVEDQGRLRLLERDGPTDDLAFVDLSSGADLWRLSSDDLEKSHVSTVADANADGLVDVQYSVTKERKTTVKVMDPRTKKVLWRSGENVVGASLVDVLPGRPGAELMLRIKDGDSALRLGLQRVERAKPDWTTEPLKDFQSATYHAGTIVHVRESKKDVFMHVLDAETGRERFQLKQKQDDARIQSLDFLPVIAGGLDEVVTTEDSSGDNKESGYKVVVRSMHDGSSLMSFRLPQPEEVSLVFFGRPYAFRPTPAVLTSLGDWNGNGAGDLLMSERLRLTLRDPRTGDAVAAHAGGMVLGRFDVNGDKILEFLVMEGRGRLSLQARDTEAPGSDWGRGPRVVANPAEVKLNPLEEPGREIPGAEWLAAALALAVVVRAGRRR